MTTVQLGSILMNEAAVSGFVFTKLTDWYTLPSSKTPARNRPLGSHGAFGIDWDWREPSVPTVEGWYLGADRVSCAAAKRALTAVGAGGMVPMTVTDEEGPSTRMVSVRAVHIPDDNGKPVFQFAVDTLAPDPRRYGPVQTVPTGVPTSGTGAPWPQAWPQDWGSGGNPGQVVATNDGTAPTPLKLTVAGGLAGGVEIVATTTGGRVVRLERVIPAGSVVVFDAAVGRAYLDIPANDITGFLTRREWDGFIIPAGGSVTVQFNPLGAQSGTPTLTAQYQPAN